MSQCIIIHQQVMVSALKALLLSTIGDKISLDTLLTEDTSKDTFIVFKEK